MRLSAVATMGLCALLAGGCSLGSLVGGSAPATYDLIAPTVERAHSSRGIQITISPPIAIRTIDSDEVLVKSAGGRVAYFSGVAWSERLPRLFQARLAETFANSGAFRAVLTNQDRVTGDLSLSAEIRDFEVETGPNGSQAIIDIYVKLVNEKDSSVVSTRRFQERTPASSEDIGSGIAALNVTFQKIALDILTWVTKGRG